MNSIVEAKVERSQSWQRVLCVLRPRNRKFGLGDGSGMRDNAEPVY